jgi:hypothetical protein
MRLRSFFGLLFAIGAFAPRTTSSSTARSSKSASTRPRDFDPALRAILGAFWPDSCSRRHLVADTLRHEPRSRERQRQREEESLEATYRRAVDPRSTASSSPQRRTEAHLAGRPDSFVGCCAGRVLRDLGREGEAIRCIAGR